MHEVTQHEVRVRDGRLEPIDAIWPIRSVIHSLVMGVGCQQSICNWYTTKSAKRESQSVVSYSSSSSAIPSFIRTLSVLNTSLFSRKGNFAISVSPLRSKFSRKAS